MGGGFAPDTEGAGTFRGAPSHLVEFGPVGCDIYIGYVSDGTINPARGVRGGANGAPANQYRLMPDGSRRQLDPCAQVTLRDGEKLLSISAGGGGYGPPSKRDPETVARDVAEGWITAERARNVYVTAVSSDGTHDAKATAALRGE